LGGTFVSEPDVEPPVPSTIEMSPPLVDPPPVVEPELVVPSVVVLTGPNFITESTDHKNRDPANVMNIPLRTVIDICWLS